VYPAARTRLRSSPPTRLHRRGSTRSRGR